MSKKTKPEPYKPGPTVYILPQCTCTFKPYPHRHDNPNDPWNWEDTQREWTDRKVSVKDFEFKKVESHG